MASRMQVRSTRMQRSRSVRIYCESQANGASSGVKTYDAEDPEARALVDRTNGSSKVHGVELSAVVRVPKPRSLSLHAIAEDIHSEVNRKAVAVEFLAQAFFNFASCSAVATASASGGLQMTLQVLVFHFLLLFVLISGTQRISGGHFNPMVSVCMATWGVLPWARLPWYIAAQLAGAAVGSGLQFAMLPAQLRDASHAALQAVPESSTVAQAFLGEAVAAFILMLVVCVHGLDPKGDDRRIPLMLAITVPLLIYIVGPVSSMCINPARAFGPALVSGHWEHQWVFWVAPILGGVTATASYKWLTPGTD